MSHAWPIERVRESDVVITDARPQARYTVIAVHEERAWIRDLATGDDEIVDVALCMREPVYH